MARNREPKGRLLARRYGPWAALVALALGGLWWITVTTANPWPDDAVAASYERRLVAPAPGTLTQVPITPEPSENAGPSTIRLERPASSPSRVYSEEAQPGLDDSVERAELLAVSLGGVRRQCGSEVPTGGVLLQFRVELDGGGAQAVEISSRNPVSLEQVALPGELRRCVQMALWSQDWPATSGATVTQSLSQRWAAP